MKKLADCPYPAILTDEASGTAVLNDAYRYWMEGRNAQVAVEMLDYSSELNKKLSERKQRYTRGT